MDAGKETLPPDEPDRTTGSRRSLRALLRLLLIVLGLWIYYLSLHPFVLVDSWSLYWDRLIEGLGTLAPGRPSLHLAAFVLTGLLLGISSASGQRLMGFPIVGIQLSWLLEGELAETRRRKETGLGLLLIGLYLAAGYFAGSSPVLLTTLWLLIGLPLGDLIGSWIVGKAATGSLPSLPADGSPESQDETT